MRVLIANRGEIAVRVVRACRELGYSPCVVYSTADRDALAVRLADQSFCVGPEPATASYLNMGAVLTAAHAMGAQAIHPGYGFLSENADFAEECEKAGLTFIGPSADHIRLMGDKVNARRVAEEAGVPLVPAADLADVSPEEVAVALRQVGLPVMIKAAAGGGGRGMREVRDADELAGSIRLAQAEARAAFADAHVYLERLVERARHVEVQVFGLGDGRVVVLGERDCTVQRRHQKLVEESGAAQISAEQRAQMRRSAHDLAARIAYSGAGTVEFLYDLEREQYYFLEMNTRLQVEHGVTELWFDVDLVRQQLLLAATGTSELDPDDPPRPGARHVLECRLLAEDPTTGMPSPGTVTRFSPPGGPGVRTDSFLQAGAQVPAYYDSLVAKVLTWAPNRPQALTRMLRALDELELEGIASNLSTLRSVLLSEEFANDRHTTGWFDNDFTIKEELG